MAAEEQLSNEWLDRSPEIGILRGVARAAGEPIRIRGGVPRNLLARTIRREQSEGPEPAHLIDFVDPLSDIDIVVSTAEKVPFVLGLIFARIALAGFTRWEGKTAEQVRYFEKHEAMTTLDNVEIVITPDGARLHTSLDAIRNLEQGRLGGRFPKPRAQMPGNVYDVDAILLALRAARFGVEFELDVDRDLMMHVAHRDWRQARLSRLDTLRIDLAALDVLLTAPTSFAARRGLERVREIVPAWVRHESRLLMQLEEVPLDRPLRVIAMPRMGAQPPRVKLETDVQQNRALEKEKTLLPWTAIRLPRFGQSGCCPPDDFSLGPLVIAWRSVNVPHERAGVVALAPPADPYNDASRTVFPVPGVITSGPTVVQRFDWGFARYIAGDGRLVYFGARDTRMTAEEEAS